MEGRSVAKLTEKQIEFLKKHKMWNAAKDKSSLSSSKESQFKDFDRRKEKLLAELSRLSEDQRQVFESKLRVADGKARKQDFKGAYEDLKEVKKDARRAANGYVDSLSLRDVESQLAALGNEARNVTVRVQQLRAGQDSVLGLLAKEPKASASKTLAEASEFRRDFKNTEVSLRSQVTGLTNICGEISGYLDGAKINKRFDDINHQLELLQNEKGLKVSDVKIRSGLEYAKFMDKGKLLTSSGIKSEFSAFSAEFDARIKDHKDLGKFQQREPGAEKISDETVARPGMTAPGKRDAVDQALSALLREIAGGPGEGEFDKVVSELKAVEAQLGKQGNSEDVKKQIAVRKKRAVDALKLLDQREAMRFKDAELNFLLDGMGDQGTITKTQEQPKRVQRLAAFDADSIVSDLALPADLKKAKPGEIQQVAQQVKVKMEQFLAQELLKPDSDLVFDLGLKTKRDFVAQIAADLQIDLKSKACTQAEKDMVNQMAEQMLATVQEKYPNKASAATATVGKKGEKQVTVPVEFALGNKKFTKPQYLTSGGLGDILRYEEDGTDPPEYIILKSLKQKDKRQDMVHELKMHRQANGGEQAQGANPNPNVVGMKGAVTGPDGGLYMAVEFAGGGDVDGLSLGMAQAAQSGALSPEARQVLSQHVLRQAMAGMKQVQDSNMTHHDIKELNYLIDSDGTVKVADFGSAQWGDDKGEVAGAGFDTTPNYEAPEVSVRDANTRITGKADTFSLGVMLNNLSSPVGGYDKFGQDKKVGQAVTAVDKLKNAMLDDDPSKRPTLEAVMQTAYMTDASANYPPEKIDDLMKAVLAYTKNVASKTKKDMNLLVQEQGFLASKEKEKEGATPAEVKELDKVIAKSREDMKKFQANIDKILADVDVKPHVEALEKANRALTGRGAEAEQIDVFKLSFMDEYQKIAKTYGLKADNKLVQPLLKALTAVDQAGDLTIKKMLADTAHLEAERIAKQMTDIAKAAPTDKAKAQASQLGVDFRKLDQALKALKGSAAA
jgi:serine/threonine protein kinase